WTPPTGLSNAGIRNPVASPAQTSTYQLKLVSDKGCTATGSITIYVERELYMPNAFTPDGDGKNDIFRIPAGTTILLENFSIYNRWGQLVFHTNDATKGWNGTINSKKA